MDVYLLKLMSSNYQERKLGRNEILDDLIGFSSLSRRHHHSLTTSYSEIFLILSRDNDVCQYQSGHANKLIISKTDTYDVREEKENQRNTCKIVF